MNISKYFSLIVCFFLIALVSCNSTKDNKTENNRNKEANTATFELEIVVLKKELTTAINSLRLSLDNENNSSELKQEIVTLKKELTSAINSLQSSLDNKTDSSELKQEIITLKKALTKAIDALGISLSDNKNNKIFKLQEEVIQLNKELVAFLQQLKAKPNQKQDNLEAKKLDLETQKLALEIESFGEAKYGLFTVILAFFTIIVTAFTSLFTYITSKKSINIQTQQYKRDRVASLIQIYNLENDSSKPTIINALNEYEEASEFVFGLLQSEKNQNVINSIITCLKKRPDKSLALIADASQSIPNQIFKLAALLMNSSLNKQDACDLLEIQNKELTDWLQTPFGLRIMVGIKAQSKLLTLSSTMSIDDYKADILIQWGNLINEHHNYLHAFESIAKLKCIENNQVIIKNSYLRGVILESMNISKWKFISCNLESANFERSTSDYIQFTDCNLLSANFTSAHIGNSVFDNCRIRGGRFINAKIESANFSNNELEHSQFISAEGDNCDFSGAKLQSSDFNKFKSKNANFTLADLRGSKFIEAHLIRPNFTSADKRGFKDDDSCIEDPIN